MSNDPSSLQALLANIPALNPPPGVQSNFDHPQTDGTTLIAVGLVSTILPVITVALRLYTRRSLSRQPMWWDDCFCFLALLGTITHTTLMIANLGNGLGKHMWDIRALSMTHERLVVLLAMNEVLAVTGWLVRMSILFMYYRLFNVSDTSRRLVWGGMAICTVIIIPYISAIITRSVRCSDPLTILQVAYCHTATTSTITVIFTVMNVASDFYILMIPLRQLRKIQMNKSKKRALAALFAAGFLACAMSVVQLIWVCVHFSDPDTLRYALWVGLFGILEVNIALLCNCAIFLPAVWKARPAVGSLTSLLRKTGSRTGRSALGSGGPGTRDHPDKGFKMELEDASTRKLAVEERSEV